MSTTQITEQLIMQELTPKRKKYLRRLTAHQSYAVANWVKENAEVLREVRPALTRAEVGERASKDLGFAVGNSAIATAESVVGVRTIPEPIRVYSKTAAITDLQKEIINLQKRLDTVEKIVKEFV